MRLICFNLKKFLKTAKKRCNGRQIKFKGFTRRRHGLAAIGANIINLDCRLLRGDKKSALYSFLLEVDLRKESDMKKIEALIRRWQSQLKIEVKVHSAESAVF